MCRWALKNVYSCRLRRGLQALKPSIEVVLLGRPPKESPKTSWVFFPGMASGPPKPWQYVTKATPLPTRKKSPTSTLKKSPNLSISLPIPGDLETRDCSGIIDGDRRSESRAQKMLKSIGSSRWKTGRLQAPMKKYIFTLLFSHKVVTVPTQ